MHDKDPQVAAMASAEPCKDLEPGRPSGRVIDQKGQQSIYQDHRGSSQAVNSSRRSSYVPWTRDKMPSFRRLTLTLLIVAFLTAAYASVPVYRRSQDSPDGAKETQFQDLLNSVSDASLHEVLMNVYEKYKHGVFPEDRTAMQAVHDDNAAMATSLVELARRQNPNITSVTVPPSSTATVVIVPTTETNTIIQTSGTDTVVVVNTETTVTPVTLVQPTSPTDAPVQSTAPQANPSTSKAPAQSSANGGGGTTTGKGTAAPSPSATTLIKTSSSTFTSTSPGQAGGSTSAGAGAVTTKGSSTQQIVYTTTQPNGSASTVTSYTVVPAGEQASTPGVSGSATTGTPSLQNGAVDGTQPSGVGLVGSLAAALVFVVGIL